MTLSVIIISSGQKVDFTTGTRAAECSICDEASDADSKCKHYKTTNNVGKCGWESDIEAAKAECSRCREEAEKATGGKQECRTREKDASYCKDGRSKIITKCDSCNPERGCEEEEICYGGPVDGGNVTLAPGQPTATPIPTAAPGSYEQGTNCRTPGGSECANADFNGVGYPSKGKMLCCRNIKYERVEGGRTMKYGVAEECGFKCGAAEACAGQPGGTHTSATQCDNPVTCEGPEPTTPPQQCVDQSQGFYCDDFSKDNPDAYCKRFETIKNTCTGHITFRKTSVNCCTQPGEPTPPFEPTSTPKPRQPNEPTPTTPPERSPHACVKSTISKTTIAPGDTVEVCTEASIEAKSHTFAFFNLGNLYGPGNPKGIFHEPNKNFNIDNTTPPPTKTRCVTFKYEDVAKPDLNAGGTIPKSVQINGYFTDMNNLFSRPDAKCVVQLNMVQGPTTPPTVPPTVPPQEVTPTNTPTPPPSATPTITPTPQPQTCGYTPCDETTKPCANGLVCLLTSTGQKYCSKPEYENRCYDNPSQTSCCTEPTPTPTTKPTNTPTPTPSPRPAQCGYPCGEDQGVCQNGEICVQSTDGRRYCSMPEYQQRCATNGGGYTNCCTAPTPTPQPTYTPVPSPTPQPTYTPIPPPPQPQQVIVQQQQPQQVVVQQQQPQVVQQVVQQVQPTYTPVPPPPTYTLIPTFTPYPTQPPQATYTPVPPPPVSGNPVPWIVVGTPVLLMLLGMVL